MRASLPEGVLIRARVYQDDARRRQDPRARQGKDPGLPQHRVAAAALRDLQVLSLRVRMPHLSRLDSTPIIRSTGAVMTKMLLCAVMFSLTGAAMQPLVTYVALKTATERPPSPDKD